LGVQYLHFILPEKSSIEVDHFPVPLPGPTPFYVAVNAVGSQVLGPSYIDTAAEMASWPEEERFLQVDSHLNAKGSWRLSDRIMAAVGASAPTVQDWVQVLTGGDLGAHFPALTFLQRSLHPGSLDIARYAGRLHLIEEARPTYGGHQGWTAHWRLSDAPDPRRVLLVAGSTMGVGHLPENLTYWFARTFSEVRFIWNSEIDWAEVARFAPDLLVTQTRERLIVVAPRS
jgi:hypothetical protein